MLGGVGATSEVWRSEGVIKSTLWIPKNVFAVDKTMIVPRTIKSSRSKA